MEASPRGFRYALLSLFVAFHGSAIVTAPLPRAELSAPVEDLVEPWVRILRLGNQWKFFSPDPVAAFSLGYEVDVGGQWRSYEVEEFDSGNGGVAFRYWKMFADLEDYPELERSAARFLCRRHAALDPERIRFLYRLRKFLLPGSYLKGARMSDPDAWTVREREPIACGDTAA